ncbi:MAG: hypothetical protein IKX04_10055 [Clostridiales bacterium]|nr:hypothetical protein [Clostridiales bacterium]MBR5058893.1 hypothetical protein [Clostridiales bacterium]
MGLLDRFLGDVARKSLRDAIDSATGRNSAPPMPTAPVPQQQSQPTLPPNYVPDLDIEQKLDKILSTQFPTYGFGKEVPPTTLGAVGANMMPYTYVVYLNGQPKLFIMRCWSNTCASRGYRFSKEFAASLGVPLINFLESLPNEESYIIDRLHQYL